MNALGFNPVLGFLSVSTIHIAVFIDGYVSFNPVLGFLSVSTAVIGGEAFVREVSIPCWVF